MLITVICQHCRKDFESEGMEKTEFCPHCGRETSVHHRPAPAPVVTAIPARPAAPPDELQTLIHVGYVTAVVLPLVGFIVGVILLAKNRPLAGLGCVLISIFAALFFCAMFMG